jgi:Rrf2 family transcriptional regulator, cysteine metabolism repressor
MGELEMKLSTRTRYGVRALLDIAQHSDEGPVLLKDIAERQRISKDYLEHILIPLKVAGLIRTTRGVQGGFVIAKPPRRIRLDEVVQILERRLALVKCVDDPKAYPYSDVCATRILWQRITEAINQVLKSTTLLDLMERPGTRGESEEKQPLKIGTLEGK